MKTELKRLARELLWACLVTVGLVQVLMVAAVLHMDLVPGLMLASTVGAWLLINSIDSVHAGGAV